MKQLIGCMFSLLLLFQPCNHFAQARSEQLLHEDEPPMYGDYAGEIREKQPRSDGIRHVDTPRLIQKLKELKVNTYFYLIWHEQSDWDDLRKEFLPAAKQANIDIWVYLVPPSESQNKRSEPYGTDYPAWFRAVGRLSREHANLKGIVMDDFNDNVQFFTPQYLKKMREAGAKENAKLKFYPQIYYPAVSHAFIEKIRPHVDGIVMTFRDDQYRNTQRIDRLVQQINEVQSLLHSHRLPFILMIYASKLSATPASPSVQYVEGAVKIGLHRLKLKQIQGLITYVLHKEFTQEEPDNAAFAGKGYSTLFAPSSSQLKPGDYVELKQRIYLNPIGPYRLTFYHFSVTPLRIHPSRFVKQILIDHEVVWEQKMISDIPHRWSPVTLELTPYLKGKKNALLSLRMVRTHRGPSSWTYGGFDQLISEGFHIENSDFEKKQGWTATSNNPTMLGEILMYDPQRRLKTYQSVRKHFHAFALFDQITTYSHSPILSRRADLLVTCVLLNQTKEAFELLDELMSLIVFDQHLTPDLKHLLIKEASQLEWLLIESSTDRHKKTRL